MRRAALLRALPLLGLLATGAATPTSSAGQEFRELHAGNFRVAFWPGHERLAAHLLATAPDLARLPAVPHDVLDEGEPVRILVAPDARRYHDLAGGAVPEWGAGIAIPATNTIVLPVFGRFNGDARALARVLRHELAHLALHRHLAPARPPRWFDEGFARWAAGEWDRESAWQLRLAFALQRAPPLDSIALSWPDAAGEARVAYLLATTAIVYLVERSGEKGLDLLLARWRDGGTLDSALRQTYGLTLAQFEEYWRRDVQARYGWALLLSQTLLFWAITGLLLLLLFARRRRHDRERLHRLRANDPPDDPAYWLEEESTSG